MATTAIQSPARVEVRALNVTRLLVAGAATSAAMFVLCWIGTYIPFSSLTHAYITLFTSAEVSSGRALIEGGLWSLLFGGLVGGLFALIYNFAGAFARR